MHVYYTLQEPTVVINPFQIIRDLFQDVPIGLFIVIDTRSVDQVDDFTIDRCFIPRNQVGFFSSLVTLQEARVDNLPDPRPCPILGKRPDLTCLPPRLLTKVLLPLPVSPITAIMGAELWSGGG